MPRRITSRGISLKSHRKLAAKIGANMLSGLSDVVVQALPDLVKGIEDASIYTEGRWDMKMSVASEVYDAVKKELQNRYPNTARELTDRKMWFLVRSGVQKFVMKAIRSGMTTGEPDFETAEADLRAYFDKHRIPDEVADLIVEIGRAKIAEKLPEIIEYYRGKVEVEVTE